MVLAEPRVRTCAKAALRVFTRSGVTAAPCNEKLFSAAPSTPEGFTLNVFLTMMFGITFVGFLLPHAI